MGVLAQQRTHEQPRRVRIPVGYWFVLPAMLFFTLLVIYPSGYIVFLSLFASGKGTAITPEFTNFSNFIAVLKSANLVSILLQTGFYAGVATLLHLLLGFLIALLLNVLPLNIHFVRLARTTFLIPWAVSPTVVAIIFRLLLHPQVGPFAIILKDIGYTGVFSPLGDPDWALVAVTLTNVWTFTPFYFLMILSSMQAIDPGLYEAAVVDGASGIAQIFNITLPSIKNTILTLAIFDFVTTAAYFDLTWIMTQGGPINKSEILSTWIYRTAFQSFEFGKAAAIGMILFVVSIVFTIVVLKALDKE